MSLAAVSPASAPSNPNQTQSSAQPSPSSDTGHNQGGDAFDYKKAFSDTQATLESLKGELDRERSGRQQDSDVLGKIREVFQPPSKDAAPDPTGEWEQMLDYYIAEGVKAKERGAPMPLTINNGIMLYRTLIENYRKEQASQRKIAELEAQVKGLADPQQHINREAYTVLDSTLKRGIDSLFGTGNQMIDQKRAMFRAAGERVAAEIDRISQKDPAQWDMLRRDPAALQDVANRALRKLVPPKALQLIAEDNLKNTEMNVSELRQAFKEADSIEDPRERQNIKTQIRQEILERMWKQGKIRTQG